MKNKFNAEPRIYLSGPCPEHEFINRVAEILENEDHRLLGMLKPKVISSWHSDERTKDNYSRGSDYLEEVAARDVHEIRTCDIFMQFVMEGSSGGMWSELGLAYALDKRIIVATEDGKGTSLFHFLPKISVLSLEETGFHYSRSDLETLETANEG